MKPLLKYKFALLAIIAFVTDFLIDLKQTTGINDIYLELIGSGLGILSIMKKRLEAEYLENTKNSKIIIKFSLFKGIKDFATGWISDWKLENLKASENIPSHMLIGASLINIFLTFKAPHWSLNVFASIFLGFSVASIIESIQRKFFDGVYNVRDIRQTINGCFLWYFIASITNITTYLTTDFNFAAIISLTMLVISIVIHSSFKHF